MGPLNLSCKAIGDGLGGETSYMGTSGAHREGTFHILRKAPHGIPSSPRRQPRSGEVSTRDTDTPRTSLKTSTRELAVAPWTDSTLEKKDLIAYMINDLETCLE